MKALCTGCQKIKKIILSFSAEANGKKIEHRLCRECLKKQAKKN
jgi:hypothetical protein